MEFNKAVKLTKDLVRVNRLFYHLRNTKRMIVNFLSYLVFHNNNIIGTTNFLS